MGAIYTHHNIMERELASRRSHMNLPAPVVQSLNFSDYMNVKKEGKQRVRITRFVLIWQAVLIHHHCRATLSPLFSILFAQTTMLQPVEILI